jgi:hypothetical protein
VGPDVIAACAGLDVWTSWVTIGSLAGYSRLFGVIPTDWTLAPIVELYWGYALLSWLGAAPGPRSRQFAMWSAGVVFALSLTGQGAAHLARPGVPLNSVLIVFVTNLPVIVLAASAVLMHLRHADRAEAEALARAEAEAERQAAAERAEADESARLAGELARVTAQLSACASALESARRAEAEALARAEAAAAALSARAATKPGRAAAPQADGSDLAAELRALEALRADPGLRGPKKGGELARLIGVSGATARRYRSRYLNADGTLREALAEPAASALESARAHAA